MSELGKHTIVTEMTITKDRGVGQPTEFCDMAVTHHFVEYEGVVKVEGAVIGGLLGLGVAAAKES